jgi:hypothetical protein
MKTLFLIAFAIFASGTSYAELASTSYVDEAIINRVDMSSGSTNNMAGSYTITGNLNIDGDNGGTLVVPTQPLPAVTD